MTIESSAPDWLDQALKQSSDDYLHDFDFSMKVMAELPQPKPIFTTIRRVLLVLLGVALMLGLSLWISGGFGGYLDKFAATGARLNLQSLALGVVALWLGAISAIAWWMRRI